MSLLERCKAGEERAWRELFAQRAGQVFRWAVLLGLRPAEAEDAAQEVLSTAARRIETCEAEAAMTTWLFQITRRVVANARRRGWLRRWVGGGRIDELAFSQRSEEASAYELTTRQCLGRLSRQHVEILLMHEVVGMTQDECAHVLGVPQGTVASRLRRAQKAFRKAWDATSGAASPKGGKP